MKTLVRRYILRCLILVCTVCLYPTKRTLGLLGHIHFLYKSMNEHNVKIEFMRANAMLIRGSFFTSRNTIST